MRIEYTTGTVRTTDAKYEMIAIGSNVGTGLFIGSGKALHTGGPLALVAGFILIAASVTLMMQSLGEVC